MDMQIYFPGGKRVYADYGGFTIETDQPARGGGDDSAPAPFDLFLASIGTCAGIYALGFMQQRGIDPEGSKITMRMHHDPAAGLIDKIDLELELPADFPEKYRSAVISAMNLCTVKKHLHQPPEVEITTVAGAKAGAGWPTPSTRSMSAGWRRPRGWKHYLRRPSSRSCASGAPRPWSTTAPGPESTPWRSPKPCRGVA